MPQPDIRYARNERGSHIAYQTVGAGPFDLVFVPEWCSNIEVAWESPAFSGCLRRLSAFSRVIWFDKLGTGLSDPLPAANVPALEAWMDDVRVVMEVTGSAQAAVVGTGFGAMMATLFAASHPERVTSLVLMNAFARTARASDYPAGMPTAVQDIVLRTMADGWGYGAFVEVFAPQAPGAFQQWFARYQRASVSPGVALSLTRAFFETDIRSVLPVLETPTLILHRVGDRWARVGHGRYLAQHISQARYVELAGSDHFFRGEDDPALDEIEEFLTGARHGAEPNRILATVLFMDIVDSTVRAAAVGDREWRNLLERYYRMARDETKRFRGREVDTAGDSFFAAFDGPARAIRCACALRDAVAGLGICIRAGLHTGECERIGDKITGIAVHLGARVAAKASPNEVLVSSTVKDLVAGSGLRFTERGTHMLKGIPGEWRLFSVEG